MQDSNNLPALSVEELLAKINETGDTIQSDIEAYDEHTAMRAASLDDGKTTTERALDALQRPERFNGEHKVARAWLRDHAPDSRISTRRHG